MSASSVVCQVGLECAAGDEVKRRGGGGGVNRFGKDDTANP